MAVLFDQVLQGSPTVGASLWVDLGVIPSGYKIWIGTVQWVSLYKPVVFAIRTNTAGQSTGTTSFTTQIWTWSSTTKAKSITQDTYQKGRLHTASILGTGTEHLWLYLTSKTATAQVCSYKLNYCLE